MPHSSARWFCRASCVLLLGSAPVAAGPLVTARSDATAAREAQKPGRRERTWRVRWPAVGAERVVLRRLRAPPGYVRSVRVLIDGTAIAPNPRSLTPIGAGRCAGGLAHQRWLWSGRLVYVLVGLAATPPPAGCAPRAAGRSALLTVAVTTVGT